MTTLTVEENTITVLVKSGEYKFHGVLGMGHGFLFSLDEVGKQFLGKLITNKRLIPDGKIMAMYYKIMTTKELRKGIKRNCARILTLGIGIDCSSQEAIVILRCEEVKDDV